MATHLETHVFIDVKAPGDQHDPVLDLRIKAYVKDGKFRLDTSELHNNHVFWVKPEDVIEAMRVLGVLPLPVQRSDGYDR